MTTHAAQNGRRQAEQVVSLGESSWWKQNFALTLPSNRMGLRENVGPSGVEGRVGTGSGTRCARRGSGTGSASRTGTGRARGAGTGSPP